MKLENLTFRGGTHMKDYKSLSSGAEIVAMPAPEKVLLTVSQHIGAPAKVLVSKGDHVNLGQKIAEAGGFVSAPVHASVSGEVTGIVEYLTAFGTKVPAIEICSDGLDTPGYETVDRSNEELSAEQILSYIKDAGIVGMGGAGFPTHVKLTTSEDAPIDTIIINGAECEPYLTCDDLTMRTYPEKVVEGLKLIMKATGAKKGYIAIENNKPKAIDAIEKAIGSTENIDLAVLKTKYPQGDEKRIISAVTGRKVATSMLPKDVGCIVDNVGTACAIVDAVYYGKPLYERVVTVTGHAVNKPSNVIARLGSTIRDIVEFTGGYASQPGKILFGGPMMGLAQYSDEVVIDKRNNGILVLTEREAMPQKVDPCIRCGRCVEVCPSNLEPLFLAMASKSGDWETAQSYYADQCTECGLCSYICPAKRPLTELIRFAKKNVIAMKKNK
ncbi:MAG: electron transport complex subunit RsxC [Peptoniphilaceae bacterium]|nr:electron transport complex subunit RsxC [Peptoniphilaceae bacterium]MDY3075175.1 electron transport complex subunit RsxC [Peptoniphilaceae bacterium]